MRLYSRSLRAHTAIFSSAFGQTLIAAFGLLCKVKSAFSKPQ
jgi:hypothetical protein